VSVSGHSESPSAGGKEPRTTSIVRRSLVLAALYACLTLMLRITETGTLSLLLAHLGADTLPRTFLAISFLDIPFALLYVWVDRRVATRPLLAALAVLLAAITTVAMAFAGAHQGAGLFAAYLTAMVFNTLITIHWGAALLELFTVDESLRAVPVVYLGAHVGNLVAGLLLRHLAHPVGTEHLLVVVPLVACGGVVALTACASRLEEGRQWRQGGAVPRGAVSLREAVRSLGMLGTSSLLRAIAWTTAVMVLLRLVLRFLYGTGFEHAFPDPDDLTRFLGTYTIAASVAAVVLQVVVLPVLLRWLGVGRLNLLFSYFSAASLLASVVWPGLPAAVAGRFADNELKAAVKTPVSPLFYEALGEGRRKDGRAVILGVVSPLATIASSLLLVAATHARLSLPTIAGAGVGFSLAFIVLSHVQGRAYDAALADQLVRRHRAETGEDGALLDTVLARALRSDDRRLHDLALEVSRRRKPACG